LVKAGFTQGECRDDLKLSLAHLVERGADAVILGCTEMPLLIAPSVSMSVATFDDD